MSGTIAWTTLSSMYINSFIEYLNHSKTIGGIIFEQSLNVHNLFNLTLNLVQDLGQYRRPSNPLAEQYLTDPICQTIDDVRAYETKASDHIFEVTLVSKSVTIFEWPKELDAEKFVNRLNKYVQFYQQKAQCEIENLDRTHFEWLRSWNETYEEFAVFVVKFFKNGLAWSGSSVLALHQVLGDSQINPEMSNIEPIENSLIQSESTLKIFSKKEKKWLIQNQQNSHRDLVVNTAKKDDAISIYSCEDCTVVAENIVDSISLELCKRVTVLLRNAAKVAVSACTGCNLHCFEMVQDLELISCENCGIYLSDKSLDCAIITTKCSGIHVNFPFEDGLYQSFMIPDELKTKILGNRGIETVVRL
ncbi:adenylyl cyclase-associated protein 1-like [Dendroctonus ponderosae]|uniref:adenylyl cyclase-associated protein 1-like n=1 Tax=Dendroctonus ponderosae TaxID=77166 RepID=UPI002034E8B7|nr:adenylyl cyclase-associated protein 1-like [Dendroctonus ponderosae]